MDSSSGAAASGSQGKCPVDHTKMAATKSAPPSACPMHEKPAGHPSGGDISACPMHTDNQGSKTGKVYNVYMQEIDPTNNMPANPNQKPAPGQKEELPTKRQQSSIPKGGTEGSWLYPSEQMFYNALVRKNKSEGVQEKDMSVVVAIHNNMNETTWKKLLDWEKDHQSEHDTGGPRLRKFTGKPHDLSLKAKIKSYFGFGYPFDRHDWFVTRGDKEVRYIIDYYYDNERNDKSRTPADAVNGMVGPIWVDVRPALDSPTALVDRVKHFPERMAAALKRGYFYSDGLNPNARPKEVATALDMSDRGAAAAPATGPAAAAVAAQATLQSIDERCATHLAALQMAADDDIRRNASVALNYCIARTVCKPQADAFMAALQSKEDGTVGTAGDEEEAAFGAMTECNTAEMQKLYEAVGALAEEAKQDSAEQRS